MTGQASKVARGLRTIGNNIADTANKTGELSYSVDGTTKSISLLDEATGDMKSTYQVLGDIAQDWDKMSQSEQQAIAISLAGKNQFEVFGAVLQNFDNAVNATNTALDSSGSAAKENAAYMESLQAKITALKAQFQELVLGDGGLTSFIKILLEVGTNILKLANTDVGRLIITLTAVITTTTLLNKAFKSVSTSFIEAGTKAYLMASGMTAVSASEAVATGTTIGFTTALKALTVAWATSPFGIATIAIGAIAGIVAIVDALTVSVEEQNEKINESIDAYNKTTQELESTKSQLEEVNKKIEEINSLGGAQTAKDGELEKLQEQSKELENQIILLERKQQVEANTASQESLKGLGQKVSSEYTFEDVPGALYGEQVSALVFPYQELNNYTTALKQLQTEIDNYDAKIEKAKQAGQADSQQTADLIEKKKQLQEQFNDLESKAIDYADQLDKNVDAIKDNEDAYKDLDKKSKKLVDNTDDAINAFSDFEGGLNDSSKELEDTGEEADNVGSKLYDLGNYSSEAMNSMDEATSDSQQIISDLASQIDEITSAYQTAVDAQYEYNQQGYLSVDTYSQLMQLAPQYLAMMIDENGQLYANADATTIAYQAKVYEMGITAARAQIKLADSLAGEAGAYAALGSAAANSTPSVYSLLEAELKLKQATMDADDYNALVKNINAISLMTEKTMANAGAYTASIKPTNAATGATNRNTGANKGNTGSRKSNTDAIKAQTNALKAQKEALEAEADALEKELDDYEIVIDYVKDLLKEEQEAVEEEKDAQLEAIQDKIDALEEEQEVFEENIDAQIDALEKQKDETEEYWDAQIEAIQNANDALEENMELQRLQEALANAKSQKVKVLKGGRFVYAEDEEAISEAEQELADYEMQLAVQRQIEELERLKEEALNSLEQQIEELENYRDEQKKNYEQQLKDLQDHYDAVEEEYDKRIKQYDAWLKQFEDMLEASSKRHAEILYNELVGEQGNWDARIAALGDFVNRYEQKKNELDGIKSQIEAIDNQIKALQNSARDSYNATQNYANLAAGAARSVANSLAAAEQSILGWYVTGYKPNGSTVTVAGKNMTFDQAMKYYLSWAAAVNSNGQKTYSSVSYGRYTYADGVFSVPDDRIALVADPLRPSNRELVVGSKINKGDGVLSSLKKGTGVIPAGQNLTENLVNLARWSSNGGFERTFTTMNQSSSKVVHIENINLPNVQNGEDFVNYLETNFVNDSLQFANIRG